jgi:hypothetical protein
MPPVLSRTARASAVLVLTAIIAALASAPHA